jgi:hypothetical protein
VNPWDLAKHHPTLLSYTIVGMREELGCIAERQATIGAKLQALATLEGGARRRSKLGRLFIASVIHDLQAEHERLEQRQAEIVTWLPELEAYYAAEYAVPAPLSHAT